MGVIGDEWTLSGRVIAWEMAASRPKTIFYSTLSLFYAITIDSFLDNATCLANPISAKGWNAIP